MPLLPQMISRNKTEIMRDSLDTSELAPALKHLPYSLPLPTHTQVSSSIHQSHHSQQDDDEQLLTRLTGSKSKSKRQVLERNARQYIQQRRIGARQRRYIVTGKATEENGTFQNKTRIIHAAAKNRGEAMSFCAKALQARKINDEPEGNRPPYDL